MTDLYRTQAVWQGWGGAPGYTNIYSTTAANPAALSSFFDSIKVYIPNSVSVSFSGSGIKINDATGALTGTWSATAGTSRGGTGVGGFTSVSGAMVKWVTNTIVRDKIVLGRTFLVP